MRNGNVSVELLPHGDGVLWELPNGQVLARPGQVYVIAIRNHSSQRAVVEVSIDGRVVSGNGLVIDAFGRLRLERPVHETECGRFTVFPEGREDVFGADGGRDNPDLGLIEVRYRRELPQQAILRGPEFLLTPWIPPAPIDPTLVGPIPMVPYPASPWRSPIWVGTSGLRSVWVGNNTTITLDDATMRAAAPPPAWPPRSSHPCPRQSVRPEPGLPGSPGSSSSLSPWASSRTMSPSSGSGSASAVRKTSWSRDRSRS